MILACGAHYRRRETGAGAAARGCGDTQNFNLYEVAHPAGALSDPPRRGHSRDGHGGRHRCGQLLPKYKGHWVTSFDSLSVI